MNHDAESLETALTLASFMVVTLLPHPGPLPLGEGESLAVSLENR